MNERRIQLNKFGTDPLSLFDSILLSNIDSNYPPYNIIKDNEHKFVIEVATTGFTDNEISVTLDNNLLQVTGSKDTKEISKDGSKNYLVKKLANRSFSLQFRLDQYVEVLSADNLNGVLTISLERKPPNSTTKKIEINKPKNTFELGAGTINGSLKVESDNKLDVKLDGYSFGGVSESI